jgi:hypothetical protein
MKIEHTTKYCAKYSKSVYESAFLQQIAGTLIIEADKKHDYRNKSSLIVPPLLRVSHELTKRLDLFIQSQICLLVSPQNLYSFLKLPRNQVRQTTSSCFWVFRKHSGPYKFRGNSQTSADKLITVGDT